VLTGPRTALTHFFITASTILLIIACGSSFSAPTRNDNGFEFINAQGYRYSNYRAPTPKIVPGGKTLNTKQLRSLIAKHKPVLIDVQAVTVRPELAEFDMDWLPSEPRETIPGAIWLPNVGYDRLDDKIDEYFKRNLERLTKGNKSRHIVIFCVVDCWLSWNAVQRASEYGYQKLYWYRGGTDTWQAKGYPLEPADPVPIQRRTIQF